MKKLEIFNIFLLFIFSFFVNYYYGSLGVFPIDTFAFFDSANFINKGFLPIRDYWTSNGFLVDIFQSFFFKFFGVSWFTYLLHPSLLNFIFAFLTYKFLIFEGLSPKSSLFYSVSVAILAYPSVGVPFSDHHSLILSIISIYGLIYCLRKKSLKYLYGSIFVLALAFLCKQIPASLFIILFIAYLIYFSILNKNYLYLRNSIIFSAILLCLFSLVLVSSKIGIKNFLIQYIFFPLTIGTERSDNFEFTSLVLSTIGEYKFFLFVTLIIFYQFFTKKKQTSKLIETNLIFLFVVLISVINQEIMKNQNILFFLLPILLGTIHSQIIVSNKINSKIIIVLLILLNIFITFKYHERFNIERKFMDLQEVDKSNYVLGEQISKKLKGLKWVTLANQTNLKNEIKLLKESIEYIKNNKENSLIITEYQFINSDIDHNIYSPNRWNTIDGVSYPLTGNIYRNYYIEFYKNKLIDKNIKNIFTILPLDEQSFDFILRNNCYKTIKINNILFKHELLNCFANQK